jgi:hypothetical protein
MKTLGQYWVENNTGGSLAVSHLQKAEPPQDLMMFLRPDSQYHAGGTPHPADPSLHSSSEGSD